MKSEVVGGWIVLICIVVLIASTCGGGEGYNGAGSCVKWDAGGRNCLEYTGDDYDYGYEDIRP